MGSARYDGLADWYAGLGEPQGRFDQAVAETVRELLGHGDGDLLDVGCGGGRHFELLASLGWGVTGVDESEDQLRLAAEKGIAADLVRADARALPFPDLSFDAVVALMISTDVELYERAIAEAGRVLRLGGCFVHVGNHPCFVGPHSVFREEDRRRITGPGYRRRELQFDLPAFRLGGVREKVGAAHTPLDVLLNAVIQAGLRLERVVEREDEPPTILGLRAVRLNG